MKISFNSRPNNGPRPFKFLNVWTSKPCLLDVIRDSWTIEIQGSPLRVLCSKLLATRRAIQQWNKQHFGNVVNAIREAEAALLRAEEDVEHYESEDVHEELYKAQAELNRALAIEEQFWRQKVSVKWLNNGDRNTKYFHAVVKQRRVQGAIHRAKNSNGT